MFGPLGLMDYGSATLSCKIWSLPFLGLLPHALHPGAIQGKEGIKFCHLATLRSGSGGRRSVGSHIHGEELHARLVPEDIRESGMLLNLWKNDEQIRTKSNQIRLRATWPKSTQNSWRRVPSRYGWTSPTSTSRTRCRWGWSRHSNTFWSNW